MRYQIGADMRVSSKGQVTIPAAIRKRCNLLPGTEVEFVADDDGVRLVPAAHRNGKRIIDHLRGRGTIRMTTDEIMALTRGDLDD